MRPDGMERRLAVVDWEWVRLVDCVAGDIIAGPELPGGGVGSPTAPPGERQLR